MKGRLIWIAAGFLALALAGGASAYVLTRHVTLKAGQCTTWKGLQVCAAKGATKTVTRTRLQTVTQPAQTVTQTVVQTVTAPPVTVTVTTPGGTSGGGGGAPVTEDYSGNGDQTEAPFTTSVGETLSWTWQNTNGDSPTGMFINDDSADQVLVDSDGNTTAGSTYLPAGTHTLDIVTIGNWTVHVGA